MQFSNFHTHTQFCDGANSIEENVLAAKKCGLYALGFSSHAIRPFSDDWHVKIEQFDEYCTKVRKIAQQNENLLIRLGFEADFIPGITAPTFENYAKFNTDFLIGSVHFVYNGRGIFEADDSQEAVAKGINEFYDGNAKNAVERYFEQEREMLKKGGFSIIGHADLIRKPNANERFFREDESWYKEQLRLTADEIKRAGVVAEINTGGIARKKLKTPYPSREFLSMLFERGVPITITSDAHSANKIDFAFEDARKLAKDVGYTQHVVDFPRPGETIFAPL